MKKGGRKPQLAIPAPPSRAVRVITTRLALSMVGESNDPILALMRHLDLPATREDYLKRSGIISGTYRDRFASRVITGAASCPSRLTLASVTTMARRCPAAAVGFNCRLERRATTKNNENQSV